MFAQYDSSMQGVDFLIVLVLGAGISGVIGLAIAASKGKGGSGFLLGALLGPIGWIVAAVIEPSPAVRQRRIAEQAQANAQALAHQPPAGTPLQPCRWCAELIQPAAVVCRFCNRPQST